MFDEQDRQYFYNEFKNNGYEVGSYDDFKKDLNNKEDRDWYYNEAKNMGYDVGTQADFDKMVLEPAPSTSGGGKQVDTSATTQSVEQKASTETKPQVAQPAKKQETIDKEPGLIAKVLDMIPTGVQTSNGTYQPSPEIPQPVVKGEEMPVKEEASSSSSANAAPVTTPTGVVNNEGLMDTKLANYIENWKQRPDKEGDYFANMVADLLADGTANSNEEAVNMVMPALYRYANRSAMDVTNQVVSSLPDDTVQDAEQSIGAQWYSHGVQDKLKQEADSMGISYDDYVAHFLKPAMVQSLVNKYGPNYRNIAEGIATRLYSHDENVQDRLMNQDINDALSDVISKYTSTSVAKAIQDAEAASNAQMAKYNEQSKYVDAASPFAIGAIAEANKTRDPQKILGDLQKKFGKLYRNPKFLNDMSNAAFKVMQRYGMNGTLNGDPKQFKPMINAAIKNELDQLEVKGMIPRGSADYILKTGIENTIIGKVSRKIMQTDYQNWLEDIANQQYQPGFWENVASGALTFAGDAWSYWLPGAAGGKLTKSMVAKAEGKLAGDLMAKGMERKMAERAAKVLIGKSKAAALKNGAVHGAVTFGGQSAISKPIDEVYRTGQFDENGKVYNPSVGKIIADTLGEVTKQSAVGAIMQGGTIANMIGKGRGLATNILADVGGKVVDSGIMTGQQLLERMAQDPNFKPTGKDAAESFLESMANLTAIGLPGMVGKYARFKDAREFNKKFDFTDQDIAELKRFGYDGLRDAFEKVGIGEYAVVGENAQRLHGQLTQKYMDLMNDKSVPEVLKAKMMAVVEGKRPSSFSPVVDSEVYRGDDGKYYLETYNKDGGVIDRKEYSSHDAARNDEKKLEYEKTLGLASVLEGEFHNEFTQEHLDGLYNKAAQKYNMGEKLTDEDKAAVYLHQNAGAIKEIMDKQQKGVILTDEEQKQVNAYRHYYDSALENSSVMREFVNTFEDSNGVARGTLRKALESKDKKYAPLVESYLKELYNSIELKREMKQTMDDLYNTSHGNEQKRIEQGGVEGEKPTAPVEGSAGGQEPPVSEGPSPYQGNTDVSSGQGEGVSTANSDNSSADVITSDAFVMGQNAYKNGDSEALQAIGYNSDLATGRLKRAFADNEKMPDIVANAYNEGRDMEQFVAQRASSLTPAQKEAISKYVEAMDAKKGAIDALQHADDGYGEALKQQLWPYQTEDGNIVPATLDSGKQVFLKKDNEYGGAFVVVSDEQGLPTIKQVSKASIIEKGTPVPLDEYIEKAVAQQKDARNKQFISQFDGSGLKRGDIVSVSMEEGDEPSDVKIVGYTDDGHVILTDTDIDVNAQIDPKKLESVTKDKFNAWRQNALNVSIGAELDAEDAQRANDDAAKAEADKKQRYANGIVGLSEGQPDYSSKDTDPNVAADYLQEQFGEDHGKLLNLVNGSRDDIKTQLDNKKKAAAEYQNWLDTNADLDPEKAKKVEDELSLVNEQIADLDARFKNWNTIRNSVMTPDEVKAMTEERKAEVEKAGVDETAIVPSDDFHVLVLDDKELKKQYPTMDKANDYITSQRKDIYHTQEDVERKINEVNDMLEQYINGETELEPNQLMELNTTKAQLEALQTNLSVAAKGLKAQANKLSKLYKTEVSQQEMEELGMTPSEQRKVLVSDAIKKNDLGAIIKIYKDASVDITDLTPQTLEEAVSEYLSPHSLNPESLQYELGKSNFKFGIGKGYDSNKFNYLIAKKGTGMSVNEFAVKVYNDLPVNLQDMGYTDQDVRNTLLDMFKSYDSVKEMKNVALMNRIAAAEDELSSEEEFYEAQKKREIIERQAEIEKYKSYIHEKELSLPSESELDHIKGLEFDRMMEIEDREREYKQYVKSILPELADYDDRSNEEGYGGGSSLGSDSSRRGVDEGNSQGKEVGNGEASSESEIGEGSDSGRKGRQETGSLEPGEGSTVRGSHLPQEASFGERLKSAIAETETEPTEAQKKAGNYKKGHLSFGGYDYTVETPKGVTRSGKDEQGKPWSVTMHDTYGYILGKIGVDGDHIDMFINDAADLDTFDGNVYVVDQVNPETGEFDEHKVMYGYPSEEAATEAYLANYSKGWKGLGKVTSVPKATFDKWLESSDRKTKPFAEYAMVQKEQAKFDRDVKEVKPSEMTEVQKVAYDAVSTMFKKAGIPVKVVSNDDMEKVAEAQGKGVVYGYTDGKEIVLNQEHLNPNTPIHEYQHLWRTAAKNMNPELIEHGDKLIMQTQLFADLKQDPNYNHLTDEQICDEAFARLTGEDGAAILEQMVKDAIKENPLDTAKELSVINKLKEWLKKFWYWALDTFTKWKPEDIKKMTLEDIRNLVLRDLANGVDPRNVKSRMTKEESVEEKIKAVSQQFGVDEADVAMYANAIKKGSTAEAARARANIKRHLLQANEDKISSFKELLKYTKPVNEALKENFGDVDAMIEERKQQMEAQRNAMEAARKRAEEEEAKRQKHLEELSVIPDDQLDKQYMDALAKGDDATAREMLDEAARRKGYDDTESAYQGVGAWAAPGNPGYESDKARRDDWESSGSDVNLEDMALGYTPQPDDYFSHPERYSQNTPHGLESVKAINTAIDAIKNGEKDVKVKVYRAVPTSVKEGKLRNGDWVTPSKKYAEMHGTNRLEGKYRIIEDEVPATQLWWDGNDANEFGFDDGKAYKYKNAKNNRKLNDLVTYDDEGDVIPPSKRFNSRKQDIRFHRVTEPEELEWLNKEKTFRMYSGMQEVDGKLYSPMAAIIDGKRTDATEIGAWMGADERPDLVKGGKFQLVKTDKNPGAGEGPVRAAYNPYMHTSTSMMNDQFTGAYARGNIKVVEWEIPESEKTSGYRAEGAKDAVGLVPWHSGSVNGLLPKDRQRSVMLSRWRKAVRVVPDSEVAESIAKQLEGTGLVIPWNVVTPNQLRELVKLGVPITTEESGQQAPETKEKFLAQMEELKKEFPQAQFVDVKMTKEAYKEWGVLKFSLGENGTDVAGKDGDSNNHINPNKNVITRRIGSRAQAQARVNEAMGAAAADFRRDQTAAAQNQQGTWNRESVLGYVIRAAKANASFIPQKELEKIIGDNIGYGEENYVYHAKYDDTKVVKLNDFSMTDSLFRINEFIDRINAHNEFMPEDKYTPLGFAYNHKGDPCIVMEQPHIKGTEPSREEISQYLMDHGFKIDMIQISADESDLGWTNGMFDLWDAEPRNVIKDKNGDLHFFDTMIQHAEIPNHKNPLRLSKPAIRTFESQEMNDSAAKVKKVANLLGGAEAVTYTSSADVPEEYRVAIELGAKGWYDPTKHTVHVYLPNCADANEAQRTVFHEKIGHEGMEVLLGGEDGVRKFANFVYRSVGKDVRGKIIDFANKYDPDWKNPDRMNVGTQEYIARLAEEGPKTAEDFSLWTKIKHYLIKVLKKLGVRVPGLLNDKDLRYYLMKAGKALHVWDNMPKEKQEALMKQASNAEIKDALSDGAGKGKPRQKKGESTIQYMKRVQEWRKWKNAREDENDPEPPMFYDIDKDEAGKKEWAQINKDWRERHHLAGEEPMGMPIRMEGEEDGAYMTRIHEYEKWKEAMKDQEDPMPDMFAFEKKKQEEVKRKYEDWLARHELLEQQQADLDLYEGKIYPAETNPKADALEQQVMQDLAEVTSTDVSKEGAARTVKHAVIHRRKNMEEASADDAIYINDVKNRIEKMADSGAFDKLLSDYQGKPNRAEKLAEAIPYIIEAPRRLRDLAHDLNATGAFDKGHIHIQPADVEAIQPYVADLIAETGKKHTELKDGKEVEVYDDPQAVGEVASKMAQTINANHQGEEGFVPIDGTDILSDNVLPLVKQQIVPKGIDYKNLSPEMKSTIDSIRDWYNYTYDWLKDNHTLKADTGYNVDYVNHIWDKEKSDKQAYALYVENRQRTKSPNEKKRTISTLMEGISVGLVPKTTDITKMMAYYSRSNIEAWVNKTMLQELSGLNVIERNEDGEIVSSDPLLSSTPPFNLEQYQYFEIPGVGPVWVYNESPKEIKVKNPITDKENVLYSEASAGDRFGVVFETYQSSRFWKRFDKLASTLKKLELGFSGFHAGALTEVYMVQDLVEYGPKKAMAHFMKYIFADTMKNHQLPCFANPQDFQEAATHGVKFGATNDYAAADVQNMFDNFRDTLGKIQEKLENGNVISKAGATVSLPFKIVSQLLSLINKGMDRALWDFLHDGLKLATYRMRADKTKERAKKYGWTDEQLSKALDEDGQFVNDMFGGQHWDVLGVSHRTLRKAGRWLLSPDWNTSTTRHFLALTGYGSVWNEATFENFKEYYKHLWAAARGKGELTPEDWGRFSRQKSAFLCYGLGFMVFYEGIANGISAAFRALDEEKERKKAEEIRKTNPSYKSMYELAYPNGMKWYDYLMRGNSLGQQSKIFLGRYADGTEMYIRHGKQFREIPEYFFNEKGEFEIPGPFVNRLVGKANPLIRMALDDYNYLSPYRASHSDKELQRKYGKLVGNESLGKAIGLLHKNALYAFPFLIPSQENKEFKAVDFFFPSSKGFSPWKAQSYFKDFILSGDMEGIAMTYQSCLRNGIDAEAQIKAAIGSVKALESAEMSDGVTSLQEASKRFDAAKSITEKKKMRQKMKKFLSQSDYKAFTQKEALDMVQGYLNGDEDLKEMEKAESKYLMKAKAEDVTEDWRIQNVWNGTMETYQEYQRLKDVDKAKANAFKNSKTNKRLFAARKAISAARRKMNKAKKQMDGTNDTAKLVEIRNTRKELLEKLNGME